MLNNKLIMSSFGFSIALMAMSCSEDQEVHEDPCQLEGSWSVGSDSPSGDGCSSDVFRTRELSIEDDFDGNTCKIMVIEDDVSYSAAYCEYSGGPQQTVISCREQIKIVEDWVDSTWTYRLLFGKLDASGAMSGHYNGVQTPACNFQAHVTAHKI